MVRTSQLLSDLLKPFTAFLFYTLMFLHCHNLLSSQIPQIQTLSCCFAFWIFLLFLQPKEVLCWVPRSVTTFWRSSQAWSQSRYIARPNESSNLRGGQHSAQRQCPARVFRLVAWATIVSPLGYYRIGWKRSPVSACSHIESDLICLAVPLQLRRYVDPPDLTV